MNASEYINEGMSRGYIHPTESVETLTIDGHRDSYPVYEVRLDQLKYNIRNGRIATHISRFKQEKGELPPDGSEDMNMLVESFIEEENPQRLKKTKLDIKAKGQQRPAVVLSDGTVIDGNRRFTCLRQLEREEGQSRYLRCFVLDSALDDKSLKGLELELQFGQDEKLSYDPVARLVDIYEWCIAGDLDQDFYRTKSGLTKAEMDSFVAQAKLMVEFLEFINADGQFHIVEDLKLQGPLNELVLILKKCHDDDKAEDIKVVAFTNFLTRGDTDITRLTRNMGKVLNSQEGDVAEDFIEEQIDISTTVLDKISELPPDKDVDIAFIRDVIRADQEVVQRQRASYDKYKSILDNAHIKDEQLRLVKQAESYLQKVVAGIFPKLEPELLSSIIDSLSGVRSLADALDGAAHDALSGKSSEES